MKTFLLAGVLAASASLAMSTAAFAACKTPDLTGTWLSTDRGSGNAYCLVEFKKNGWIVASSCPDLDTLVPEATLEGRFGIRKDCSVTGSFDELKDGKKTSFTFTGTLNPNTNRINGQVKARGGKPFGYKLVKQY